MKKAISLITILVILAGVILAGSPSLLSPYISFAKCLGGSNIDGATSIQQTNDGGYIVAGYASSYDGDVSGYHGGIFLGDYWIVKLDEMGKIQWQKCLGGWNEDVAYSIQQTSDGGYIVAGETNSNDGDVSGFHGTSDYWIVKLDETGNIQWQKCLGGSDVDYAQSIQQTSDGGFIVAGTTYSHNGDVPGFHGKYYSDYWVVKLDKTGGIQWQKCLGGSYEDEAYSIQQTSDGGYIVAGSTSSFDGDVSGYHGDEDNLWRDYWIVKLNEKGELEWQKCLGGSDDDRAFSILQTNDGGFIVAGETSSNDGDVSGNHGHNDYWIVKLNNNGELEWQKCLGGSDDDRAFSILQTNDGGFIVAGETSSNDGDVSGNHGHNDYWIVKLNNNGELQWQKCLGGSDYEWAQSILQTTDGGYIVAGKTESNDGDVSGNHGKSDYWIVKLETE